MVHFQILSGFLSVVFCEGSMDGKFYLFINNGNGFLSCAYTESTLSCEDYILPSIHGEAILFLPRVYSYCREDSGKGTSSCLKDRDATSSPESLSMVH